MRYKAMKPATIAAARSEDPLDQYLRDIHNMPLLSKEEEYAIGKRAYYEQDPDAQQKLVTSNLRFVVSYVKKYQNNGLTLLDLIAEGNFGLVRAAKKFDPDRGVKFITYAVWWVRQSVLAALAENSAVRVPLNANGEVLAFKKQAAVLSQVMNIPSEQAMRELEEREGGMSRTMAALHATTSVVALDAPMEPGSKTTIGDLLGVTTSDPFEQSARSDIEEIVETTLAKAKPDGRRTQAELQERDVLILQLHYGINEEGKEHTLEEIGSMLGITRERVRQLRDRSLKYLRKQPEILAAFQSMTEAES